MPAVEDDASLRFSARMSEHCLHKVGKVLKMIVTSSQRLNRSAYSMSSQTIWLKVVRFLPLTCQRPVKPGTASQRRPVELW